MRIIELRWQCVECETVNLGRNKTCTTCGAPRESGKEMAMDGLESSDYDAEGNNVAPTVTDPKLLDLFQAGADWFCTHCSSGNRGDCDTCNVCGAPSGGQDASPPDEGTSPTEEEAPTFGAHRPFTPDSPSSNDAAPSQRGAWAVILIGILSLLFVGWGMIPHDVSGKVSSLRWEATTVVERWTPTVDRLWYHQVVQTAGRLPVDGKGEITDMVMVPGSCRQEHYDNERYVCGHHEECHAVNRTVTESYSCSKQTSVACGETCSSNHNGSATCHTKYCSKSVPSTCTRSKSVFDHNECHTEADYCSRPIFKDKCDYTTHVWKGILTDKSQGTGTEVVWPVLPVGTLDRVKQTGVYNIEVTYGKKDVWKSQITDLREFQTWKSGQDVKVTLRNFGYVSNVSH